MRFLTPIVTLLMSLLAITLVAVPDAAPAGGLPPTTMPVAAETKVVRWHPPNKGDVLSIPKLRINNNSWGKGPELDGAKWANFHHEWLVDDDGDKQQVRYSDPRNVIRRVRAIGDGGVIQLVNPFIDFPGVEGQPEPFGPEWANKMRDILRLAYRDLRGTLGMTAGEIDQITWLIDHERWSYETYSGKATVRPWAEHAIEWTVWALREAGFDGPVINHATGVDKTIGLAAQTTNKHLSYPVLAGYVHDDFIYTPVQVLAAMDQAAAEWGGAGGWAYTHHEKNDPSLIDAARKRGARWVLLWN
jgi:hypothetical protein